MQLAEVLKKLEDVTLFPSGAYWAKCPCHDDDYNGLRVLVVKNIKTGKRKISLECMDGCDQKRILDALGLHAKDLKIDR